MTDSTTARAKIVELFRRDLIGPSPEDTDLANEVLKERPSRWYLTGFLAPVSSPNTIEDKEEEDDLFTQEEAETSVSGDDTDGSGGVAGDSSEPEAPNTHRRYFPSSIGLTVLLKPEVAKINAVVTWGDYEAVSISEEAGKEKLEETVNAKEKKSSKDEEKSVHWKRSPEHRKIDIPVIDGRGNTIQIPDSSGSKDLAGGLEIETHSRIVNLSRLDGSQEEKRILSVFLVNKRFGFDDKKPDPSYAFQAKLELICENGFEPRADYSNEDSKDWDLQVADLHYRNSFEWAVGSNVAASWDENIDLSNQDIEFSNFDQLNKVTRVWTNPLPQAEVNRVIPNEDPNLNTKVHFKMEELADICTKDKKDLVNALQHLPEFYQDWISAEENKLTQLTDRHQEVAKNLIAEMSRAKDRIANGIKALEVNDKARQAFRFMNLAVANAARRRNAGTDKDPSKVDSPTWRPFQLAFILLNLSALIDKQHEEREFADLLFFPTGGGKTEAYLGLSAFMIALRRLQGPGLLGAGIAVIMRYTLRLLTLDQLNRAAGVICALELLRTDENNVAADGEKLLGDWPIEIGLWVGSDASPNWLKGKGQNDPYSAVGRINRFRLNPDRGAPAPIKACPWCGTEFSRDSFSCTPNVREPLNLEIRCANNNCEFTRDRPLPILTVDETIYRRLPAFLIATIDKFAQLPWLGESGAFFGHVNRFKKDVGFFGANEPGIGTPIGDEKELDPPDLIIQDELHLISGPLGTIAGLYETAIDQLATRKIDGNLVRPKIIASTATVRRASTQINELFDRKVTKVFPPPGVDRSDSFFARAVDRAEVPGQLYVGLSAQGRGPKLVFLRSLTTLLASAQSIYAADPPSDTGEPSSADPYMTTLCYFNALRDLGGARRIVEDQVQDRVTRYGAQRCRIIPDETPFVNRKIKEPLELTSRVSTDQVAKAKQRLEKVFSKEERDSVDVALATNMISVGLDITRLGLMLVQGQPKTAAEYIQATSRVGRDPNKPGIVFTILNVHRPRDRSHFEQFGQFHRSFYRAVEATSVTPWVLSALNRALAAVVVSCVRHLIPNLTPDEMAKNLKDHPKIAEQVIAIITKRAKEKNIPTGPDKLVELIHALIQAWKDTAETQISGGSKFTYADKKLSRLLHAPLDPRLENLDEPHKLFVAGRSMRDVENQIFLDVRAPRGNKIANEE